MSKLRHHAQRLCRRHDLAMAGSDVMSSKHRETFKKRSVQDVIIDRTLGTTGVMAVTSYNPRLVDTGEGLGMDLGGIQELSSQDVAENNVTVRLYAGRVIRGELQGTRVIMKAYPQLIGNVGQEADRMASNELVAHGALQPPSVANESEFLGKLLAGLVVEGGASKGEQWLIFRNTGIATAAEYAGIAAQAGDKGEAVGEGQFWDRWDKTRPLRGRKIFILKVLRHALEGLQFMHRNGWLHQSLGPGSVVLSTVQERDVAVLRCQLRDLAFAVDVRDSALLGGLNIADLWDGARLSDLDERPDFSDGLWRRARSAGVDTATAKRNFGISDDIYSAGLLLAYMVFVSLSESGSVDGPSLQRLIETTFRLDFNSIREYCEADSRWDEATSFLGAADGAGWDLLASMMNTDWRLRPTAASCLLHPFLKGAGVE